MTEAAQPTVPEDEGKVVHVLAAASRHMDPVGLPGHVDGVPVKAGDAVLLPCQRKGADNGVYVIQRGPWERPDIPAAVHVRHGVVNAESYSMPVGRGLWAWTTHGGLVAAGLILRVIGEMDETALYAMDTREVETFSELIEHAAGRDIRRELRPAGARDATGPSQTRRVEFLDGSMVVVSAVDGVVRLAINTPKKAQPED